MAVREFCVFLLQVRAVGQQNLAERERCRRTIDRPAKALARQHRQEAAVIDMRVSQDHGIEPTRVELQRRPVAQAQLLVTLEQAAIDQDAPVAGFQ